MSQDRWSADTEVAITGVIRNAENGSCSCNACAARAVLAALADAGLLVTAPDTTARDEARRRGRTTPGDKLMLTGSPECMSNLCDSCDNDLGCECHCHQDGPSEPRSDEPAAPPADKTWLEMDDTHYAADFNRCECERWRNGATTCPVHGTTKPPRVWAMPSIPADVQTLRDDEGNTWRRYGLRRDRWTTNGTHMLDTAYLLQRAKLLTEVVDGRR